jgi:predicted secreted protein
MAQPKILRGTYFVIMKGDGATPTEAFTALCGLKTRTFRGQINTNDIFTRDCADPEDVPVRNIIATGKQWTLSGEGDLDRNNIDSLQASRGVVGHYRFLWTEPDDDPVYQGYWGGSFMLTQLEEAGPDDAFATVSLTFESDGEITFTEVTPT